MEDKNTIQPLFDPPRGPCLYETKKKKIKDTERKQILVKAMI